MEITEKYSPNLDNALNKSAFISIFIENRQQLDRLEQLTNARRISEFKQRLNQHQGTADQLLDWIENQEINGLDAIAPLRMLTDQILNLDLGFTRRAERILAVLEILSLYSQDKANFRAASERKLYLLEKASYVQSFRAFNSTWKDIRPKEKEGKLVIEFPKAHNISNGQRDILCLVTLLEVARRKLKKAASVLIIDEVFDYLDEGNLIAAQYYVTEFISSFKAQGRRIYPLILTHLNPGYFKNYSFKEMRTYYLDTRTATVSVAFRSLVQQREHPTINPDIAKYLFHYHTGQINKRAEFAALGLRQTWGEGDNFVNHVNAEAQKYINDEDSYDPYAVCCALRRRVEEKIHLLIPGAVEKAIFLDTHRTAKKLEYAEGIGVVVPEHYYLLNSLYNDGLHWHNDRDNESPPLSKIRQRNDQKIDF